MAGHAVSERIMRVSSAMTPFLRFVGDSAWSRRDPRDPATCDYVFGNPHELPLPEYVRALQANLPPRDPNWFAYKLSEVEGRRVVTESLRRLRGLPFEEEDVFLTNGAFAALSVALATLVDDGDEVVFVSPPWFFYESMIVASGAAPVRVHVDPNTFDLDLGAIAAAITSRTRAIIVNSPHNPTGKIVPSETLEALATLLREAAERHGRRIYLLSDEAYSRILFDGRDFPSPTAYYDDTLLIYTYGKTLLTPGQRIGFIALPPAMRERPVLRDAILAAQLTTGFAFPNALLQHSLAEIDTMSIDIEALQRRRDHLVAALSGMGYEVTVPEGTFYLVVRSPLGDDMAFADVLAERGIYVLPGSVFEMPGHFRLSLTASDAMVERSLEGFERAVAGVVAG
ncbi:MAG: aminotransferase class I/II-fold pyridoxal phosphate-dependent enzyme [Trueperaceae bacterium]|nr:aminotransferase class I/II-fold pyridoxal phosphate-dependent enzyme [Trueperaceae bacterium]